MMKISEMPKYQTYKDSTEGWIGDVPEHWDIRKLKHLFYEKKHRPNMSLNCGAISFGKVVTKDDEKILLSTKASYQEVLSGEFLINPLNLNYDLISLRIALSEVDVVVSAGYIVIREKEELQKQYFKYLLHRYDVAYMKLLGSGVRQTISFNHIANSLLVFPPLEEQSLIAAFLDKKTALIDEAISIKEKQINLLKERKQIIIQQAVTQGLDPNVPMKDSGVDWIGKIPAHWEVKKMKFIFDSIQTGTTPVTSEPKYFDGDVDWYNPKDLNAGYLDKSEKTISELAIKHGQAKIFPGDSVLIVGIGATCGKTAYLKSSSAFNQQITGFSSRHENAEFMYYLISMYSSVMLKVANYTTLPILNNEFFKHFLLPCPSKIEQDRIVGFLRIETLKFEKTIEIQLQQIERLKEYKTTLINSAVTGKIKITPEMVEQ
ncbi:restriction endonuclease subunit S [Providencia sp. PAZ2]|uniref:restriction endonuclease subunit S n=1 Tax=Providencia lanzhouensis TaxID=3378099 RepID=UPI003D2851F1